VSRTHPIPQPFVRRHDSGGPTDENLIAAHRGGDPVAFNRLFDRYRDRAIGYAWRMLRNAEEAEETALEAFCRVLEGAWHPGGSFRAFLFTVVHRLCLDKLRKRRRTLRFLTRWSASADPASTPEHSVAEDERRRALEVALAALPEDHRAAVLLYYGQELPSKDVAQILGCSDQQVRSRLSYARRCLRDRLITLDEVNR
jgi:RNA polymerase sigma-70 factor (ECF subfamily)